MIGKNSGAVTLILRQIEAERNSGSGDGMFICHCFLHLKNLCGQALAMSHVMTIVVKRLTDLSLAHLTSPISKTSERSGIRVQ